MADTTPIVCTLDRRGLGAVGAAGVACVAMCSAPALIATVGSVVVGSAAGGVAVAGAAAVVLTRKLRSRRNRFSLETEGPRGCSC